MDPLMTANRNETISITGALGPILLSTIFGANAVAIKISQTGLGTFTAASLRFCIAAVAIAIWARLSGRALFISRAQLRPLLIISMLFSAQLSLFYLGLSKTLASRAALIVNVVPFLVLIFAHFFIPNDRISGRKILGTTLGFCGISLVLFHGKDLDAGVVWGDGLVLLTAVIWSANAVYTKTVIHRFRSFQLVLFPMLIAAPILLMEGWLWDGTMIDFVDGPVAAAMVYQSLICAAIGFVAWNHLLQRYGASTLHTFIFIMPISGIMAGGMILNEPMTASLIAGAALVAAGIIVVNINLTHTPPAFPTDKTF
jgi:drug/metabolite transporter (DMT)-like permease